MKYSIYFALILFLILPMSCVKKDGQFGYSSENSEVEEVITESTVLSDSEQSIIYDDMPMDVLLNLLVEKNKGYSLEGEDGHYKGSIWFTTNGIEFSLDTSGIIGYAEIEEITDSFIKIDVLVYFIGAEEIAPEAKISTWKYVVEIEKSKLVALLSHRKDGMGIKITKFYKPIELIIKQYGWNRSVLVSHDIDTVSSICENTITGDSLSIHTGDLVEVINLDFENYQKSDLMMAKIRMNNKKGWIPVANLEFLNKM